MASNLPLQVPAGVSDLLPVEAAVLRQLEQCLLNCFRSWGYQEVMTPTFEYAATFQAGSPAGDEGALYKFIDRQGRVLALRPEMTAPIARLAATSLRRQELPLRLGYSALVFRYEEPQAGRRREFHQAGVELIGAGGEAGDAEIIALAVESLVQAGLEDFRLGLGQVAVTKGVLQDLGLPPEAVAGIKAALASKDLVALERIYDAYQLAGERRRYLELLATIHGGREALEEAQACFGRTAAAASLAELARVWEALGAAGLEKWLFIDLGILRDFDYYSGIVFEGYAPGLGVPVCGGGRYDGLLAQFGYPCPATGFALGLERLLLVRRDTAPAVPPGGYLVAGPDLAALLNRARELRCDGGRVVLDGESRSRQEAATRATARGLTLVWVGA